MSTEVTLIQYHIHREKWREIMIRISLLVAELNLETNSSSNSTGHLCHWNISRATLRDFVRNSLSTAAAAISR